MRRLAAPARQYAGRLVERRHVVRLGLLAYQYDLFAPAAHRRGAAHVKHGDPRRRARRGRYPGHHGLGSPCRPLVEHRVQQLLELFDLQAKQALRPCYQALAHHVGRELYHCHRVGLGRARLQEVEPAALHGKLNVLRLAVVALKLPAHADQLGVGAGHLGAHEINGLGRARAGHHVLALRVDQVLAKQSPAAVAGIAREHDPGGAVAAHVAKHHRDHVDGRPVRHVGRDALLPAVHDGALAHPAVEYSAYGHLELPVGIRWKPLARVLLAHPLELGDDPAQRRGI